MAKLWKSGAVSLEGLEGAWGKGGVWEAAGGYGGGGGGGAVWQRAGGGEAGGVGVRGGLMHI